MWKNCSNKKTPQVSEIRSKKSRPVNNNLSPNTPPIEFFNMFCDDNFIDAIVYIKVTFIIHNAQLTIINYLQMNDHPQKKVFDQLNQSEKLTIFLE